MGRTPALGAPGGSRSPEICRQGLSLSEHRPRFPAEKHVARPPLSVFKEMKRHLRGTAERACRGQGRPSGGRGAWGRGHCERQA